MKQKNIHNTIQDINSSLREVSNDIQRLQSGLDVNANTIDRISEKVSQLQVKTQTLENQKSFSIGDVVLSPIFVMIGIIGLLLVVGMWGIDAKLSSHTQQVNSLIESKLNEAKK